MRSLVEVAKQVHDVVDVGLDEVAEAVVAGTITVQQVLDLPAPRYPAVSRLPIGVCLKNGRIRCF